MRDGDLLDINPKAVDRSFQGVRGADAFPIFADPVSALVGEGDGFSAFITKALQNFRDFDAFGHERRITKYNGDNAATFLTNCF